MMAENRLHNLQLWNSIELIRKHGHRLAQLDPLHLNKPKSLKDLTWSYRLIEEMRTSQELIATQGLVETERDQMTASELVNLIESIYVGQGCGVEFSHLSNEQEIEWLTSNWEKLNQQPASGSPNDLAVEQKQLAKLLLECETFDHFMAAKFPTTKRYGCEGAEPMMVVFDEILRLCHLGTNSKLSSTLADDDLTKSIGLIEDVVIGMPHRGRLNLLACLLNFDMTSQIFNKTMGNLELNRKEAWMASGDVLSHLSTNVRFVYGLDRHHIGLSRDTPEPINISLLPNPSHLEISSPMVMGVARGRAHNIFHNYSSSPKFNSISAASSASNKKATTSTDFKQYFSSILPIQVHGDASLAGQGIIQETLQMSQLDNFSVGGSIHLVVNNQIGYTTDSSAGRSSHYCSDIFKFIETPIVHVNGLNIDSLLKVTKLALAYRQKFAKDFVIDLVCFRKHGHNELDEPSFTQPLMYEKIRAQKSIPQLYCDRIGMSETDRSTIVESFKSKLQVEYKKVASMSEEAATGDKKNSGFILDNDNYRNFNIPSEFHRDNLFNWQTGYDLEELKQIALESVNLPQQFNVHPNLARVLIQDRKTRFSKASSENDSIKVDWATAEILALGSLLAQNHSVRLAGQDVARGTFSTRHAILTDQLTNQIYTPLNNMSRQQSAKIEVANTILSEEAAMAYEFGYSIETCSLTLWEAQFGDFFNTAQSIIDTLISSSESKWLKQSAITLLLPHGLDGAGPEHSSSHIERFLQQSSSSLAEVDTEAKVNWSVCFPTMPSQYFHLLRRQILRPFRKPLVVMSPKIIFRHPDCSSPLSSFSTNQSFQPVLADPTVHDVNAIDTVVLCSGKVYFKLKEEKMTSGNMNNVALIRLEELCPFPVSSIVNELKRFPRADQIKQNLYWFQEEHKNQGAFGFVERRLENLANLRLNYIGRSESELPASGSSDLHKRELEQILREFRDLRAK